MLMKFIHMTAITMAVSGLKEILAKTFGSVDKMLYGKIYPKHLRHQNEVEVEDCSRMWYRSQKLVGSFASSRCLKPSKLQQDYCHVD